MTEKWDPKFGDEVRHREWDWSPDLAEGEDVIPESVEFTYRGPADFVAEIISTIDNVTTFRVSGGGLIGASAVINKTALTTAGQTIGGQSIQPIKSR